MQGNTGLVAAATICQPSHNRVTLVGYIDVTSRAQELWAGSLLGILDKEQIYESRSVGLCARVQDGQDKDDCPRC